MTTAHKKWVPLTSPHYISNFDLNVSTQEYLDTLYNGNNSRHYYCKENKTVNMAKIYISSKKSILLIGGFHKIYFYNTKELWMYSLLTQKCNQINNISLEGHSFGFVLCSNERYIIIFGGYCDQDIKMDEISDNIYVLDIKDNNNNNWKIKQSKIHCPLPS
eukprot:485783_1